MTTIIECTHSDTAMTELGTLRCPDCRTEFTLDGKLYREPEITCWHCLGTAEEAHGSCCSELDSVLTPIRMIAL